MTSAIIYNGSIVIVVDGIEKSAFIVSKDGKTFKIDDNYEAWGEDTYTRTQFAVYRNKLLMFQTLKNGRDLYLRVDKTDGNMRDLRNDAGHDTIKLLSFFHNKDRKPVISTSKVIFINDKL